MQTGNVIYRQKFFKKSTIPSINERDEIGRALNGLKIDIS